MAAFGGAMTLMMVFRPEGLWPAKRKVPIEESEEESDVPAEGKIHAEG
jgi:hypothetical protein